MLGVIDEGGVLYSRGGYIRENFRMGLYAKHRGIIFFDVQKRRTVVSFAML